MALPRSHCGNLPDNFPSTWEGREVRLPFRCLASYLLTVTTDRHTEFGLLVARLSRRLRQAVDAEMRLIGLTEATWRPLIYLRSLGEGVRQKELATAMSIEGPSLVRLLDSLERRGFIERREDETDRRARGIHLTRAGRDLAVRAARIGNTLQSRLLAGVPEADLEICERVLETLEREIEEPSQVAEEPKRRKR
jgi:MarR family transcriptional regulator, transcriptional regulator for hemolysin